MPKNWKTHKLDDIADILNNKRIPLNSRERSFRSGKFPYYGASGIVDYIDDFIFSDEHVLISEDGENLRSRKTPIAFKADGKFWVNNHAHIIKGKTDFLNDWIVYYFANLDISPYLTGAVQPKLNKESLLSIPIRMPELDEVQSIASILSALDDKIELNLQQNKTLEEMAMALYKHWFVDFGPFQDGEFVESELGMIPKGWEVKGFFELFDLLSGGTPKTSVDEYWNGNIDWVSAKDIGINGSSIINKTERQITELGVKKSAAKLLPEDTVIVVARGSVGKFGIISKPMTMNQSCYGIYSKSTYSQPITYLLIDSLMKHFMNVAYGSVFDTITTSTFTNIRVVYPNEKTMYEIVRLIDPIFNQMKENTIENQTLTNLRDTLLPKLISGEVRVKDVKQLINEVL